MIRERVYAKARKAGYNKGYSEGWAAAVDAYGWSIVAEERASSAFGEAAADLGKLEIAVRDARRSYDRKTREALCK